MVESITKSVVSATEPGWSREQADKWWEPNCQLLKSIRNYQKWQQNLKITPSLLKLISICRVPSQCVAVRFSIGCKHLATAAHLQCHSTFQVSEVQRNGIYWSVVDQPAICCIISNDPAISVVSIFSSSSKVFQHFTHESPLQWRLIAHWAQRRKPLFYFWVRVAKALYKYGPECRPH